MARQAFGMMTGFGSAFGGLVVTGAKGALTKGIEMRAESKRKAEAATVQAEKDKVISDRRARERMQIEEAYIRDMPVPTYDEEGKSAGIAAPRTWPFADEPPLTRM
jgi:hypothetical protein